MQDMSADLAVVCWKWGRLYSARHVNNLHRMLCRHLGMPFHFYCITDDWAGLDVGVTRVLMFGGNYEMKGTSDRACFRRLAIFGQNVGGLFQHKRILQLDLDLVLVDDVTPLFDRPEPMVFWEQGVSATGVVTYNPSVALFDMGVLHAMWEEFEQAPQKVFDAAKKNGWRQSDTAVLNHWLQRHALKPPVWTVAEGALSYWALTPEARAQLPSHARLVNFLGAYDPGNPTLWKESPWVEQHWG